MQADRNKWVESWRVDTEVLLTRACAGGLGRGDADPAAVSSTLLSTVVGHHYLAEVAPEGPTLWERMSDTWLALLPTLAAPAWLEEWSASGWARRPAPDAAAYERARREGTHSPVPA
ncbi:hypothetical protein PHK61_00400 [Actinomycetospora lutea]|uniref:hypothetical protein n=1 Tax=Actinomycetospora lutea TaxID=663604 RepID=UPI002366D1F2|nr:hypothetical protein [Actinomycetospora lutea]MDD7936875.1 hypothetical protein [Actinomycetospora lutea]